MSACVSVSVWNWELWGACVRMCACGFDGMSGGQCITRI